jgi:hypothetical protein
MRKPAMRTVAAATLVAAVAAVGTLSARAGPAAPKLNATQIEFRVRLARADELDALAELEKGHVGAAEAWIDRARERLGPALASAQATPALEGVAIRLRQADSMDEAVLGLLPHRQERGHAVSKLNTAILRKDQALALLAPRAVAPPPPVETPPPPPPAPPTVVKVPDGLLAGLASIDQRIDEAIASPGKLAGSSYAVAALRDDLVQLVTRYLPLDYALVDADLKLGYALYMGAADDYEHENSVASASEFDAAAKDFDEVAAALGKSPALAEAAASLTGQARDLATKTAPGLTYAQLREVRNEVRGLNSAKRALIGRIGREFGDDRVAIVGGFESLIQELDLAADTPKAKELKYGLELARSTKQKVESLLRASHTVTVSAVDGWTHNPGLGKSADCVNVKTDPPQSTIDATVNGPSGTGTLKGKQLNGDGTIQVGAVITQPGLYTWTLTLYDAQGTETATLTVTSDVKLGQNKAMAFGPACPAPTS